MRYDINYFLIKDMAQRVSSGLCSFGFPRYYLLINGESKQLSDNRILDIKYQYKPTGYHFLSPQEQGTNTSRFFRTKAGGAMHCHSNDHLGWLQMDDGFYSVNERSAYRNYFPVEKLNPDYPGMNNNLIESLCILTY